CGSRQGNAPDAHAAANHRSDSVAGAESGRDDLATALAGRCSGRVKGLLDPPRVVPAGEAKSKQNSRLLRRKVVSGNDAEPFVMSTVDHLSRTSSCRLYHHDALRHRLREGAGLL